jgi:hypothetical protein
MPKPTVLEALGSPDPRASFFLPSERTFSKAYYLLSVPRAGTVKFELPLWPSVPAMPFENPLLAPVSGSKFGDGNRLARRAKIA